MSQIFYRQLRRYSTDAYNNLKIGWIIFNNVIILTWHLRIDRRVKWLTSIFQIMSRLDETRKPRKTRNAYLYLGWENFQSNLICEVDYSLERSLTSWNWTRGRIRSRVYFFVPVPVKSSYKYLYIRETQILP